MMNLKTIIRSFIRRLLKTGIGCFYRYINIDGLHKVPEDKPVIFVSNHNNALIDPLLLCVNYNRTVTLTAKNTLSRDLLMKWLLNLAPVVFFSRRQDRQNGDEGRKENATALKQLQDCLNRKECVYIFPEGKSHSNAEMMPFKTGAARLALDYADSCAANGKPCDLQIVPLGLRYSSKSTFRSTASVSVGDPVSIVDWLEKTDSPDYPKRLTKHLYEQVDQLVKPDHGESLEVVDTTAITRPTIRKHFEHWEQFFVGLPLLLLTFLVQALPALITSKIISIYSTDEDHPATVAILSGLAVFGLFHLSVAASLAMTGLWFWLLLYLLLLVPCSMSLLSIFDWLCRNQRYAV